jgi:hypothetical protein
MSDFFSNFFENLLYDNPAAVRRAHLEAKSATSRAQYAQSNIKMLMRRVDRLSVVSAALWSLLREKHGITDEELRARVAEIEHSKGKVTAECVACGATIPAMHKQCEHCGATVSLPRE